MAARRGPVLATLLVLLATLSPSGGAVNADPSFRMSVEPAFFRANESFQTTFTLATDLPVAAGVVLKLELPEGARPAAEPTLPPGWLLTAWQPGAARPWAELTSTFPTSNASAFAFPLAAAPCAGGFTTLAWRATLRTPVDRAPLPTEPTHVCDQRPPVVALPGHLEATTAEASREVVVTITDGSGVLTQNLTYVRPDGSKQTIARPDGRYGIPLGATATGRWGYHVEAVDLAGNVVRWPSAGEMHLNVSDVTKPALALSAPRDPEAGSDITLAIGASDNDALDEVTLTYTSEGGTPTTRDVKGATTAVVPLPRDWQIPLVVALTATDRAGNVNETRVEIHGRDTIPPTKAISPAPGAGWRSAPLMLTLDATDAGSPRLQVDYEWVTRQPDGAVIERNGTGSPPLTIEVTADGEHAVTWSARDDRGNLAPTTSATFRIDRALPTLAFDGLLDGWQPVPVTIRPSFTAPPSGLAASAWSVDGVPVEAESRVFSSPGIYDLGWSATSGAGKTASGRATLRLDATPPSLVLAPPSANGVYATPIRVEALATDEESGVASLRYLVNGEALGRSEAPTLEAEGEHVVLVRAQNAAGLLAETTRTFFLDRTPPRIEITGASESGTLRSPVQLGLEIRDATPTTSACTLDGAPWDIARPVTATGAHSISCETTDAAGWTSSASATFVVDGEAPIFVARADLGPLVAPPREIRVRDGSPIASVRARYDGGPEFVARQIDGETWRIDETSLAPGAHTLAALATDAHGHSSGWIVLSSFDLVAGPRSLGVSIEPGLQPWRASALAIAWTPLEGLEMLAAVGDQTPRAVAAPLVVEASARITLVVADSQGARSRPETYDVRIDAIAPRIQGPLPARIVSREPTVRLDPVAQPDAGSPVRRVATLDEVEIAAGAPIVIQGEGAHHVRYRAVDEAGNAGPFHESEIVIDLTPPRIQKLAPRATIRGANVTVEFALDPASGATRWAAVATADGIEIPVSVHDGIVDLGVLGATRAHLTLRAWDEAGNLAEGTTEFSIDAPPMPYTSHNRPPSLGSVAIRVEGSRAFAVLGAIDDPDGDFVGVVLSWLVDGRASIGPSVEVGPGARVELRAMAVDARGASASATADALVPELVEEVQRSQPTEAPSAELGSPSPDKPPVGAIVTRELDGSRAIVQTSEGAALWDRETGLIVPVEHRDPRQVNVTYRPRVAFTDVVTLPASGPVLARVRDPRPDLELLGAHAPEGPALSWWREGDDIVVLSHGNVFQLAHAVAPIGLDATLEEGALSYVIRATVTGGAPIRSLRIEGPEGPILDVTERIAEARVAPGEEARSFLVVVETLAGERIERAFELPASPASLVIQPAGEQAPELKAAIADAPGPGPIAIVGALAAVAWLIARRR